MDLVTLFPEIIVGLIVGGFAWAFKGWSATIERASEKIIEKLDKLSSTFQEHRLLVEKRVTKVETEIESLKRRFDMCDLQKAAEKQSKKSD